MAQLTPNIITITEDDLLRLNVTAAEIAHIFKTLANDPKTGENDQFLVIENKQIKFKSFTNTDVPKDLKINTDDEIYVTEDIGGYSAGNGIEKNTAVLDIVKKMLRNYKDATQDDIKDPSITITEVIAAEVMANGETKDPFTLSEYHEFEVGTKITFNSVNFDIFVGEYPWGPDTGVKFNGLRVDINNKTKLYPASDAGDSDASFKDITTGNYDEKELNKSTLSISDTNENIYTFAVKSSHTKGANAYGNDKYTMSTLPDESKPVYISASGNISGLKIFKIKGYFNSAYINVNNGDFRAGQMFKDLPETFINNGALKELYIAIRRDLNKTIKSITNKRTGMPQPFIKLESTKDIPSKDQSKKAMYDIYKISNKLAESVANEEYQIIYQDK